MPRQAREKSKTGIYHVMLRGIDKRDIFLNNEDRIKFISSITNAKETAEFQLHAYCLMNNHIHLLIKEGEELGRTIQRIGSGYIGWHNKKYERVGPLFHGRFKSEPVESERYFLTVLRYIHQNPLKAGIAAQIQDYQWSSYRQYLNSYNKIASFIETELTKEYFPTLSEFVNYMNAKNNDTCLDYDLAQVVSDKSLKIKIQESYNIQDLKSFSRADRNKLIRNIYKENAVSIRQLSSILGIGKNIIENAIK